MLDFLVLAQRPLPEHSHVLVGVLEDVIELFFSGNGPFLKLPEVVLGLDAFGLLLVEEVLEVPVNPPHLLQRVGEVLLNTPSQVLALGQGNWGVRFPKSLLLFGQGQMQFSSICQSVHQLIKLY